MEHPPTDPQTVELPTDSRPVSERVIQTVAAVTDTDPATLEPLYESVEPDCLDGIFDDSGSRTARFEGHVAFPMAGCQVVVWADGTVEAVPGAGRTPTSAPGVEDDPTPTATEAPD